MALVETLWAQALGLPHVQGLVDYCQHGADGFELDNGIMIRKDQPDWQQKLAYCQEWSQYLCKTHEKGLAPPNVREFGSSRV